MSSEVRAGCAVLLCCVMGSVAQGQPIIDGRDFDRDLPSPVWVQTIGTDFGNNTDPNADAANGSEIDALYAKVQNGVLYLGVAGNLETNFNKLELFFDVRPGGQNRLRGDNPDVDYDGLNRMGDDGGGNGLTFDAGFEPDYYLTYSGGSDPTEHHLSVAELLTAGGGAGMYVGGGLKSDVPVISGTGMHFGDISIACDNSNVLGVNGLGYPFDGPPDDVTTGIEIAIDLLELDWDGVSSIRVAGFVNGLYHDFVSNQVIAGLPAGWGNLGEPRAVDFSTIADDQFITLLAAQSDDLDGDGFLDAADTDPHIFNPEQADLATPPAGFYQLTYLASNGDPDIYLSTDGMCKLTLPTRFETLWTNVTVDGVWAVQNVPGYPVELNEFMHPEQHQSCLFTLDVPEGTPAGSVDYQIVLTRSPLDAFPAGVPIAAASVSEVEILVGGVEEEEESLRIGDGGLLPLADDHAFPTPRWFIRLNYRQVDLTRWSENMSCVPGALASSFDWLNRTYKLGLTSTPEQMLGVFKKMLHVKRDDGATREEAMAAKLGFISDNDLPLVVEGGPVSGQAGIEEIYRQMSKGQDVELYYAFPTQDKGIGRHCVSLVGIDKRKQNDGSSKYDIVVLDDGKQTASGFDDDDGYPYGRRRRSDIVIGGDGRLWMPGLGRGNRLLEGYTAESPTAAVAREGARDWSEDTRGKVTSGMGGGGAGADDAEAIYEGTIQAAYVTKKLVAIMEDKPGDPNDPNDPSGPALDLAETAALMARYAQRAGRDVVVYVGDPNDQLPALYETDSYLALVEAALADVESLLPPDLDLDDVPDSVDNCWLANPDQADCDDSTVGDVCELDAATDCDSNGYLDTCEFVAGTAEDCNGNGIIDLCDIDSGWSNDLNENWVPDECDGDTPGDLNCDGFVNNGDIDPFVLALTNASGYLLSYPDCIIYNADCNFDGFVNNADIDPFVMLLSAP